MPRTSFMMRLEIFPSRSCGSAAQSAVMKSLVCTARRATTYSYVRPSPITPTDFTGRNTANACATFSYQPEARSSSMKMASARRNRSAYSRFTSPRMRTPRPGPGKGCRNTISRGSPDARPSSRTSSLKSSRRGSRSFRCRVSGRPPTLWCDLMVCAFFEFAPDDLSLLLRVADPGERSEESRRCIDPVHFDAQVPREGLHDFVRLVQPQQARVDEHAGELRSDGAMDQRRGHGRVDAARKPEQNLLVSDFAADSFHGLPDV